jgi:uncharacterized membrane protein YvbJ
MVVCRYCGKENSQSDAAYCSYCGSNISQQQPVQSAVNPVSKSTSTYRGWGTPGGTTRPTGEASELYEKALARVELLGNVVLILSIIALFLVFY